VAEQAAPALGAFDRDTTVALVQGAGAEQLFAAEISPDWSAGRGPQGGYLAAMLLRALSETVADPARVPRSLTIHYARASVPGPVEIRVVPERVGRSVSTLSARIEQEGRLVALALAAFSTARSAPELVDLQMPDVPPAEPTREAGTMIRHGAPPFTRQIVLQRRIGVLPFAGSELPMELGCWLGLAEPRAIDALSLAFFSDALFSPPLIRLSERATSVTIDLTIHFRSSIALAAERDPDELCFAHFRSGLLHEGFFEEDGVIWAVDGSVLAQSRQLAIIVPPENSEDVAVTAEKPRKRITGERKPGGPGSDARA
jgi:acyl-CoA thioesterase